jgi:hypothetical protein
LFSFLFIDFEETLCYYLSMKNAVAPQGRGERGVKQRSDRAHTGE